MKNLVAALWCVSLLSFEAGHRFTYVLRSPKPNTIVCGAILSLGRRRVPEPSLEAKNAQHLGTG